METRDLTQGSVWRNMADFALPYMLAYFLQILYGLADLFVIGQYCGVDDTTAVSNGTQVMHMLTVMLIGLAMGTTVRLAHAVGAHDRQAIARTVGNTVTLFATLAVGVAAGLMACTGLIVRLIDTPAEAIAGTHRYLLICFGGLPFIVAYNVIASVFRGLGDSRRPLFIVAVACVANIALDYLLIGGLGLGPAGAALVTTLSQAISVAVGMACIGRRHTLRAMGRDMLRPHRPTLAGILNVGAPVALQDGFIQLTFLAIMVIANRRGLNDAAAVGIVEKVIGLLFIVPSAMLSTVSAIAAQNIGAGRTERAQRTMHLAAGITFGYGLVVALGLQVSPAWAVALFTDDPAVIGMGAGYLRGYAWDCALAGIHFCYSGYFTACGLSVLSFAHNVVSALAARIPLAYVLSLHFPDSLLPMGLASPAGSLVSVVICLVAYRLLLRHKKKRPQNSLQ